MSSWAALAGPTLLQMPGAGHRPPSHGSTGSRECPSANSSGPDSAPYTSCSLPTCSLDRRRGAHSQFLPPFLGGNRGSGPLPQNRQTVGPLPVRHLVTTETILPFGAGTKVPHPVLQTQPWHGEGASPASPISLKPLLQRAGFPTADTWVLALSVFWRHLQCEPSA